MVSTLRSCLFASQEQTDTGPTRDWARWLNKQENWITARHTRPNANSQATQASKGGNWSASSGLIVQIQAFGAADYRRVYFLII